MSKRFPIQGELTISWRGAEIAYKEYSIRYGNDQSLERLAERGGFSVKEFSTLYYGRDFPPKENVVKDIEIATALSDSDVRSTKTCLED